MFTSVCVCPQGGCLVGGCLFPGGCLVPGGSDPGGVPGSRRGLVENPSPRTATAAGGTHPTGMHSCLYQ